MGLEAFRRPMATILVIDTSPSVRETLRIVLGHEHEVIAAASLDDHAPGAASPALVVMGLDPRALGHAPSGGADRDHVGVADDVPLLLLNAPGDVDLRTLAPPGRCVEFLPKPFDAYTLRARVASLLVGAHAGMAPLAPATRYRHRLEYPFLTAAAAALARRAAHTDLPVLLIGEPGTGALEVARALHFVRADGGRLAVVPAGPLQSSTLRELASAADVTAVFVTDVRATSPAAQHDLLGLVRGEAVGGTGARVRVFAATREELGALVARDVLLPDLAFALATMPIPLPPLRERTADLADLVTVLTAETAARLALGPVCYTDAALARLRQYLWFGNVAELTAVVERTLALRRAAVVDADDLVFLAEHAAAAVTPAAPPRPLTPPLAAPLASPLATPHLEVLLGELAHELRNPMVTIKTFAQHLDGLLADPDARTRFANLTVEAVGRMDTLLETLLDFARFRTPVPAPTDLGVLLDQALAEHADELARRSIDVERNGAVPGRVEADAAQVLFALRNLVGGLVGDLVPHERLTVTAPAPGTLELHARAEPTIAARLAAFVDDGGGTSGAETPTLPFAIAAALLTRNGGGLRVRSGGGGRTIIRVSLSPVG